MSRLIGKGRYATEVYPNRGAGPATPGPPNGPAGGDLEGTYPNPTVAVSADVEAYFQNKVGLLEPGSVETVLSATGGPFVYTAPSLRYILSSFDTSLNGDFSGRLDVRDPKVPLPLPPGSSMNSLGANSYAVILNPSRTVYPNPEREFYRKLALLETLPLRFAPVQAPGGADPDPRVTPFIFGPYGSLLVRGCIQDLSWFGCGVSLHNEMSQSAADQQPPPPVPAYGTWLRSDNAFSVALSKGCFSSLQVSEDGVMPGTGTGYGRGGVAFYVLPRAWSDAGEIASSYVFRDDFMGATLDPAVWTKTESAAGNVTIDTRFQCVKGIGNSAYTTNGMLSVASFARSAQLRFVVDVWVGNPSQVLFGLSDGVSLSNTRYNHGLIIDNTGLLQMEFIGGAGGALTVSGPSGFARMVRVRITPGLANGALYEVQGGDTLTFPWLGGPTWTTLSDTRGVSPVNTTAFKIGFTAYRPDAVAGGQFISDVRVYS